MQLLNAWLPNFTLAQLLTTSHCHSKSHLSSYSDHPRDVPQRARAHNGARKPADVQCRAEANQNQKKWKKHRAKEICSVEQRLAGRGSRWFQTFLQTEKIRTAQILGDLIEYIPSESWTFKTFKIRRSGTELHGTSQGFGGKFIPSLPASPGLFRRSGASAPSAPILAAFEPKLLRRGVLHGLRHHLQLRDRRETAPPRCRGCAVRVELEMGITNKTQTFPRAKHWFKSWNHLRHLLLQEPNTSLQCMWSN